MTSKLPAKQQCMALFWHLLDSFENLTRHLHASTLAAVFYCEAGAVWQFGVIVLLSPWPAQEHEMGGCFFGLDNVLAFSMGLY